MISKERNKRQISWVSSHTELSKTISQSRRMVGHDYRLPAVYMVTISVVGNKPAFGKICEADESHNTPWMCPNELGAKVIGLWNKIPEIYPQINSRCFQLMPSHIHGILHVREAMPFHLGHVIAQFKAACTKELALYSETLSRNTLWEKGFNDRIIFGDRKLQNWINYLYDNPRRLWIRQNSRELFIINRNIHIGENTVNIMGNKLLLEYPNKIQVKCSRRMNDEEIENLWQQVAKEMGEGSVFISPCISRGEKEIMRRLFAAEQPQIVIMENGFSPMVNPQGRQFDACAKGRLLLVAPWEHHNEQRTITRQQCLFLNRLASTICEL
ncbi:MAG: transposase [Muribaculaceae bacterium]|nr:transposase [Muribaculaceae bacterium]